MGSHETELQSLHLGALWRHASILPHSPLTLAALWVQIMSQYPDLGKRLLATFKSYLEAELKDNPAVADNKQWQKVYQNVKEREEKARKVRRLASKWLQLCVHLGMAIAVWACLPHITLPLRDSLSVCTTWHTERRAETGGHARMLSQPANAPADLGCTCLALCIVLQGCQLKWAR